MNDPKPGWQTSEAWLTVIGLVMSALVAFHVVSAADATTISGALTQLVTAVFAIAGPLAVIIHYIEGRVALKQQAANAALPADEPGQLAPPLLP